MSHTENTPRETTLTDQELDRLVGQIVRRVSRLENLSKQVLKSLGHANSKRGKRRALALLIASEHDGIISVQALRAACAAEGLYSSRSDRANFTQDMKKDSTFNADRALWTVNTHRGWRGRELSGSWNLTPKGERLAALYADATPVASLTDRRAEARKRIVSIQKTVQKSIVIKAKAFRCAFCLDVITEDDKAVCADAENTYGGVVRGCGSQVHAICLDEFSGGRRSATACVLSRTTARCPGHYKVIAKPETAENGAA